ncbi:MAG: CoA-binding protein [Deltaproteobacteria bacterium]|nr:CoA-binding protein [Deltaproteobacteria bacterium]
MIRELADSPLYGIVNPESIVIFGASNKYTAMGTSLLASILSLGFPGPVYPVHLKEKEVLGLGAYASLEEIPDIPGLAIIVLPTGVVAEVLDACGKKGIRHAIIVSGGFVEVGEDGARLQEQIKDIAKKYGIRFLGPNCIGAVNTHGKLNATYFSYEQKPGFIGMASQSGSFITQMFAYLKKYGLGFSSGFSVGNEADIDIVDCLEYLGACPDTKVIGLYIESIRRGREFIEAARAISVKKPIVAYYVGGTDAGKKAGLSHTGSLAGPDAVYDGVFAQSGVIRARSMEELFDFCWCFGTCRLPAGKRVLIQTHSGGPGAVAADACARAGLTIPPVGKDTKTLLAPYLPSTGSVNNPVDFTFIKRNTDYLADIPDILVKDKGTDAMLMYMMMPRQLVLRAMEAFGITGDAALVESDKFIDEQAALLAKRILSADKTFVGFSYYTGENRFISSMYEHGAPVLPGPNRAARALGAMARYVDLKKKILSQG